MEIWPGWGQRYICRLSVPAPSWCFGHQDSFLTSWSHEDPCHLGHEPEKAHPRCPSHTSHVCNSGQWAVTSDWPACKMHTHIDRGIAPNVVRPGHSSSRCSIRCTGCSKNAGPSPHAAPSVKPPPPCRLPSQLPQLPFQQGAGKLSSPRPDSPTPVGATTLESLQLRTLDHPAYNDNQYNGTDKGMFTTFAFQDNQLLIPIGTQIALAKIDSGADINVMTKELFNSLMVS